MTKTQRKLLDTAAKNRNGLVHVQFGHTSCAKVRRYGWRAADAASALQERGWLAWVNTERSVYHLRYSTDYCTQMFYRITDAGRIAAQKR